MIQDAWIEWDPDSWADVWGAGLPVTLSDLVEVAPRLISLIVGQTTGFVAKLFDETHNEVAETFEYESDDTGVATVDINTGVVTAVGLGVATITAVGTISGLSNTGEVRVEETPTWSRGERRRGQRRSVFRF